MKEKELNEIRQNIKKIMPKLNTLDPIVSQVSEEKLRDIIEKNNAVLVPKYQELSGYSKIPGVEKLMEEITKEQFKIRTLVSMWKREMPGIMLPELIKIELGKENDLRSAEIKEADRIIESYKKNYMRVELDLTGPVTVKMSKEKLEEAVEEYKRTIEPLYNKLQKLKGDAGVSDLIGACRGINYKIQMLKQLLMSNPECFN